MAKQPYIPLYIGDWEQDTNCLSLEAEGAWLKIIFKIFSEGNAGVYKTPTKSLERLWKCGPKLVTRILGELKASNICDLETGPYITFVNRRMKREAEISQVRSNAVQNRYKKDTNHLHPLDSDIEYDNNIQIGVDFQKFWDAYDKKRGNPQTIKKKWEALSEQEQTAAMAYIPQYIKSQPEKRFRKDPSTFLNNKSWNDELIFSHGNSSNSSKKSSGAVQLANSFTNEEIPG